MTCVRQTLAGLGRGQEPWPKDSSFGNCCMLRKSFKTLNIFKVFISVSLLIVLKVKMITVLG